MSTRKTHLRANKGLNGQRIMARCAVQPAGKGKVRSNSRATYRFMASEIVDWATFKATDAADRCAHCVDTGLIAYNRQRRERGLSPVATLFEVA
jgi:hypothetical protein